jgi:hypothetical protein
VIGDDNTVKIVLGSRLVKAMRTLYKANKDNAKPVFSAFQNFGGAVSVAFASVLPGYGSH